jgi:hypothetical protein
VSFMQVFDNDIIKVEKFIEENFLLGDIQVRFIDTNQEKSNVILSESDPEWYGKATKLDKYFDGIQAKMILRIDNEEIRKLEHLTGANSDSIFLYDEYENKLVLCTDSDGDLNLSNFIEDDKILFLKVPVIGPSISDRFENLIDVLEDWDEAFSKIENNIDSYIYIFPKKLPVWNCWEGPIEKEDILIGGLLFDEFCNQFNSDINTGTKVEKIEKIISHKSGLDSVLVINKDYRIGHEKYSWWYNKNDKTQKIYNKNVYLSKMSVVVPFITSMVNLGNVTINLSHREVIPNLARDNVNESSLLENIGFAIGKGIHLYLLENDMLKDEQRELLRTFIDKYYGAENTFIKPS